MESNFENIKQSVINAEHIKDIWRNPVVIALLSGIKRIPILSDIINNTIAVEIERHQKKKIEDLLNEILRDSSITQDMVEDVDVIMEFAKAVDVVNRLRTNQKVKYIAKLFVNTIKEDDRNYDEFEEFLQKIGDLSFRELDLLIRLYMITEEEKIKIYNKGNEGKGFSPKRVWDKFLSDVSETMNLDKGMITSIFFSIVRSGFAMYIPLEEIGGIQGVFSVTPYFDKFLQKIS